MHLFKKGLISIICLVMASKAYGLFPINLFRPYDINIRPPIWCGEPFQITAWTEVAIHSKGKNANGDWVNVMQIWTPTQDALAMLNGFPDGSPIEEFRQQFFSQIEDNGVRGNFDVTGTLEAAQAGLTARYHFTPNVVLGLYIPFKAMKLTNVKYKDLTQDITLEDMITHDELTDHIFEVAQRFDPTIRFGDWKRIGFGDTFLMAEWYQDFPQQKKQLKNVNLNGRFGIEFPSGKKVNENINFSIPFGCDGSTGIIFGGGINLNWSFHVKAGIDVEFIHFFGNTRERRIKTAVKQTDFFLLAKEDAFREFGFTQRYNLYLEFFNIWGGLSAMTTYQFWTHGDDHLVLCSNKYSENIANTAESLQDWTMHHFIFQLIYDPQCFIPEDFGIKPQLSLFYKVPVNGHRSVLCTTLGGTLTLNF